MNIRTASTFTRKVSLALIFTNAKIRNFCKGKFLWILKKLRKNLAKLIFAKINLVKVNMGESSSFELWKYYQKRNTSSTCKVAYLVVTNFKWVTGPSSHILDIRLIGGNMHFICYIYKVAVLQTVKFYLIYGL